MISIVLLRCWVSVCFVFASGKPLFILRRIKPHRPCSPQQPLAANSPHLAAPTLPLVSSLPLKPVQGSAGQPASMCTFPLHPSTFSWNASSTLCERKSGSTRACCSQVNDGETHERNQNIPGRGRTWCCFHKLHVTTGEGRLPSSGSTRSCLAASAYHAPIPTAQRRKGTGPNTRRHKHKRSSALLRRLEDATTFGE